MRFQICNLYNTQLAPVVEASRYPPRKSESSQRTTGVEALWAQKKVNKIVHTNWQKQKKTYDLMVHVTQLK